MANVADPERWHRRPPSAQAKLCAWLASADAPQDPEQGLAAPVYDRPGHYRSVCPRLPANLSESIPRASLAYRLAQVLGAIVFDCAQGSRERGGSPAHACPKETVPCLARAAFQARLRRAKRGALLARPTPRRSARANGPVAALVRQRGQYTKVSKGSLRVSSLPTAFAKEPCSLGPGGRVRLSMALVYLGHFGEPEAG